MTRRTRDEDIAEYFDQNIDCCAPRRDAARRPGVKLARLLEKELRARSLFKTGPDQPGVSVEVSPDRVVTLSGVLSDEGELKKTVQLARDIPGVKDVKQNINVKGDWR